jgi:hypothetical protein
MAVVAVHREDEVGVVIEGVAKAREVRAAESQLSGAAQQVQPGLVLTGALDEIARAVRAVVVDDEHLDRGVAREDVGRERQDVLGLVVARQDHDGAHLRRAG